MVRECVAQSVLGVGARGRQLARVGSEGSGYLRLHAQRMRHGDFRTHSVDIKILSLRGCCIGVFGLWRRTKRQTRGWAEREEEDLR